MSIFFTVDLQLLDFKAEEVTDSSVWVIKSHDPKPDEDNKRHRVNKILCCVRNIYDVAASLQHFFPMLDHGS